MFGMFLWWKAGRKGTKGIHVQVKTNALYFGLQVAFDVGFRSIEAEIYCFALLSLLQGRKIINDICVFANRRSFNVVVHSMAKTSLSFEQVLV